MVTMNRVEFPFYIEGFGELIFWDENMVDLVSLSFFGDCVGESQPCVIFSVVIEECTNSSKLELSHKVKYFST